MMLKNFIKDTTNMPNEVWRPLKFKSSKELQEKIDSYFNDTPKDEWTITWLAMSLDTFRNVLIDYWNWKYDETDKEFSNTIKKAKLKVENWYEIDLKKRWQSWTIFALKNFGWVDKSEVDQKLSWGLKLESKEIESLPQDQLNDFVKSKLN